MSGFQLNSWREFVFVHSSVMVAVFLFQSWEVETCLFLFSCFCGSGSFFCPVVRFLEDKKNEINCFIVPWVWGSWRVGSRKRDREREYKLFLLSFYFRRALAVCVCAGRAYVRSFSLSSLFV